MIDRVCVYEARMVLDKRYRCPAKLLYSTASVILNIEVLVLALYALSIKNIIKSIKKTFPREGFEPWMV